ncbi:hypothetical protein K438DRAFT_1763189 [Mycena galopus ATCC 62051]|nr:hypothetical protein K438DRAFT_1763189 [Mycena galopus ATCC 62051]
MEICIRTTPAPQRYIRWRIELSLLLTPIMSKLETQARKMATLNVLLNNAVSASSTPPARQRLTQDIDLALGDVESAYSTIQGKRSPVRQALNLLRGRSSPKLGAAAMQLVRSEEAAGTVSLAKDVVSGKRSLVSLALSEVLHLRRALRTRRNTLASVFRLPPEILTPIFQLCTTEDFVAGLGVSHVCRQWREIAMTSSHFWSNIDLSRPRWALEMLHRSHSAPLTVGIDFGSSDTKYVAARDLVLGQLSRIQELHLTMPGQRSIPPALLLPAPILDIFHLWYNGPRACFVTAKLFQGYEVPTLRHLSLQYCLLEGTSPLWHNLVSLELIHAPMDLAMDDFILIVLSRLPYLRALSLSDSFPETLEVSEAVPVPNLETLELTASSMRCSCFLRAVWIPKCRIVLNVPYRSSDLRFLCDALDSHRADSADPILHGLKIVDLPPAPDGASLFEILFFNHISGSASPRYTFRLAAGSPSLPNWREEIMYTIMTIISLDQINILTVNCEALKLSTSLLHFKHFRSAAFYRHVEPFTNQLEGDPLMAAGDRFDPVKEAVHYPRLRRIVFHHVVFSQRHMVIILDWLAQRKRLSLIIDEILLVGCTFTTADLGSLQELVGHIHIA